MQFFYICLRKVVSTSHRLFNLETIGGGYLVAAKSTLLFWNLPGARVQNVGEQWTLPPFYLPAHGYGSGVRVKRQPLLDASKPDMTNWPVYGSTALLYTIKGPVILCSKNVSKNSPAKKQTNTYGTLQNKVLLFSWRFHTCFFFAVLHIDNAA